VILARLQEADMTRREQIMLNGGVAAGTLMGVALGLIVALFIALRP